MPDYKMLEGVEVADDETRLLTDETNTDAAQDNENPQE